MGKIVSIHSYRGGTGKSNVTANLAWLLARTGRRVAVLDTDLQSPGVHMVLGLEQERLAYTLTDFLFGKCAVEECAYDMSHALGLHEPPAHEGEPVDGVGRLFLLPSRMSVEAITRVLAEGYDVGRLNDELGTLMRALAIDLLLLDTHPGLNRETMLSTSISDLLLILLRPDAQDFHGTAVMLEVARAMRARRVFMVANKVARSLRVEDVRASVDAAFGCELIGLLPLSEEMATLGSRGLFVRRHPGHPVTAELRGVAARLGQELAD